MTDDRLRFIAASGLAVGALLGMAGSFAPTAELLARSSATWLDVQ